ncbi:hypothetical protein [Paracoccus sp. S3-43]|uniref:hypothetical protein n=1 Tax=Paracoccus sp. S3-43 TaxID=3030011 RepID=UPI0023AFA9D2|nr:hypothetical protein [Paracoccus sp. S3-43]WEF25835.1 hypothetical protein PXD02_08000 [Paracoccus sp. S3-43]
MEMFVMHPTAFIPAKPRPLTDIEFCAWIGQAMSGDRLEYHRGFLGIDATAVISTLPEPDRRRLGALASAAHRAFEAALVHLVQVRVGPDRFAYLAIARTKPRHAPIPLSQIIATEEAA